jgi:putative membrane protein
VAAPPEAGNSFFDAKGQNAVVQSRENLEPLADRKDTLISVADQVRISDAIARAEKSTSGEIVAVAAAQSSTYLYAPFMWAALLALMVPWPLMAFTWWPNAWIYSAQLVVFLIALMIFLPRQVRRLLVPPSVKKTRAHQHAVEQFLVQDLHTTKGRTGVLIFVSVAERYAEILADTGIDSKVAEGTWQGIVSQMTSEIGAGRPGDGFVHAIEGVAQHLSRHFPPGSHDPNELPDHLIILQ